MSDFDIDLTAPLDDNILKDFSPSYQSQPMGHLGQPSPMMQSQQLSRAGQQMRPQVQINQIRQQLQNSSVMQANSPSPAVSSPSPNPVNSPQPQLQKINSQQNVRIAPQQINYQQQQQQITLVSNAQKSYMNQPPAPQQQQPIGYQQQQFQTKVQSQQQLSNSASATRINSPYPTSTIGGSPAAVSQSPSQTNNMSQQATILVKNSNGQFQVLTPSAVQSSKPQQSNSSMSIAQQQQQQQQQQQLNRSQMSSQNQTIVRFPQGSIQQQGQQQVISAQQLNQQGQNLVVITTSNGGLTTLSNSNSSNLIASIKTQPQQQNNQPAQSQNFVYQNKAGAVQSQAAAYNAQNERSSLTPNGMMMQQQQRSVVQQAQQAGAATQASTPSGLDLLKCLRKFLHTLLDLAKNSLPEKFQVVQNLIQELLDERIDPETFIKKIQIEKNPPSPSLVPFLTKAINQWKQMRGNQSISISKFFEMIPPQTQPAASAQSTTQPSNQQSQQQQNTPIVISASGSNTSSNTSSQATTNSSGIPIITSISQGSLSHGQNVLILNRSSSNVGQQQVQAGHQQPIQQHRAAPQQQHPQNGAQMSQQQLQIQQLKYQQQQQQQQQKLQQVQIQNQAAQGKTSSPQIQFISTSQNGQYTIQPQFNQSGGKVTIQQQQHMQQSPHGTNIALAKVAASAQYQAQSPQQIQQNAQPTPASVKILNTSITNLKQITSPINQSTVMSPMAGISSPIKIEQHHLGQQTPQSPAKLISKVIKMEEIQPKIKTESDDDSSSMFGVDLEAEKKSLMGSGGAGRAMDQIRVFKEEKFLNIMILHKKFVEIAKKHKLEDVSVDVASLVSHATQEYLRGILEKLNVVSQHRLDLSMRSNDAYEMTNDVKSQIKFMEELDKIEKKRKDEADRERLMKAAKSRSKGEDGGELSKLKQKAKEVIQAESDELRRQDANKTALAAIGPRKKRKIEDGGTSASGGIGQSNFGNRVIYKPKIKRVSLRDMIFVLEQEKEFRRSTILYKALNK